MVIVKSEGVRKRKKSWNDSMKTVEKTEPSMTDYGQQARERPVIHLLLQQSKGIEEKRGINTSLFGSAPHKGNSKPVIIYNLQPSE